MKLIDFYNRVIKYATLIDPRKKSEVVFDDTAILCGNPDTPVRRILVGIDIEVGEILLADKIRKEEGLDLVIAHHPEGKAQAAFYKVMQLQVDLLTKVGISKAVAQSMLDDRMEEVARRVSSANHTRTVDVARILDIPFMCIHTPADNHVAHFLDKLFLKEKPKKVQDIVDILMTIPEYRDAEANNAGPKIILGSPKRAVGKIFTEMTGGTEGNKEVFSKLYKRGIRTLVSMHLSEEHFRKVKDNNLNAIIAGHISSDTLGLNLLLDKIEKEEKLSVIGCSGFRRFSRN